MTETNRMEYKLWNLIEKEIIAFFYHKEKKDIYISIDKQQV
ncbi:hypothetical protein [Phocaeicola coprocola]